jgi:hypothetical protein
MQGRFDIQLNKDFINANNDIEWIASDTQHIIDIIQGVPGSYKENPNIGVAVNNYLNSTGQEKKIARNIALQLQGDLYECNSPEVKYSPEGKLIINPNAKF